MPLIFLPWRWVICKREIGTTPLRGGLSISVFLFPKTIFGRGKEPDRQVDPLERKCLSFPSLSGCSTKKKASKEMEERGHAFLSEEALELNVAYVLSCGSRDEFSFLRM
jgi:hypothetical protein